MKILSFIKKTFITITALLLFIITASLVYTYTYGFYNVDEQAIILKNYTNIQNNFYSDNNREDDVEAVKQIDFFISSLSPNVAKVFSKDWAFVITDQLPPELLNHNNGAKYNPDVFSENSFVAGVSNWRTRTVFIKSQTNKVELHSIFIHELGHCFDYEFGSVSSTDEFKNIYLLYKNSYIEQTCYSPENYASSSESEFLATLFKEYFISPDYLKLHAPEAYDFINSIYKEVSGDDTAETTLKYDLQSVIIKFKNVFNKLQSDM